MKARNRILSRSYLFVFLLPVFFVLHGLNEYLFFVPVSAALWLFASYMLGAGICWLVFFLIYRNIRKALLAVFVSLVFYFFFGWFNDVLKALLPGSIFTRYSFLIPALGIIYLFLLFRIRRSALSPAFVFYLNALFILLLVIDIAGISYKLVTKPKDTIEPVCKTCVRPDVHLIVLDGYAGRDQLEQDFGYKDSSFFLTLEQQGFHVIDHSRSNYPATALSVSSMLNMEYHNLKSYEITDELLNHCYRLISQNKVSSIFRNQGYYFINNSIFDIGEYRSLSGKTFLVSGAELIASQTLSARMRRDLYENFIMKYFPESRFAKDLVFADKKNNDLLYQRLKTEIRKQHPEPVYSYTHLMMPHFPYYNKADGSLNAMEDLQPSTIPRKDLYIGYLEYTNKKIAALTDDLIRHGKKNTVIILVSDHGFRYTGKKDLYYSTLGAVYRSDRNYSSYHDSLSNVNQFRILFNDYFRMGMPLLKDDAR